MPRLFRGASFGGVIAVALMFTTPPSAVSQEAASQEETSTASSAAEENAAEVADSVPDAVEVAPVASDEDIAKRLERILKATDWFRDASVRVEDGVVFLSGEAVSEVRREWAVALARRTESVTAVVNNMTVRQADLFDLSPAVYELRELGRQAVLMLPKLGVALLILAVSWIIGKLSKRVAAKLLQRRISSQLLRQVLANLIALPVFVIGVYLALRVSGLTQLAATVVGGTGLFGLIVGIAFRDIAENFLASLLISMHRPFTIGDLVDIEDQLGFVQSVTTRGTTLMTFAGNHIQIPNATVYKATVTNFTANPKQRQDFILGLDYADDVTSAQTRVMEILNENEFVLQDPPPMVLVEELATSTINLKVFFWVNGEKHSLLKVKSSVMKRVMNTLDEDGFSFPDGDREIVFPQGVPVRMLSADDSVGADNLLDNASKSTGVEAISAASADGHVRSNENAGGEEDMSAEQGEINKQAAESRLPSSGDEILID